MQNKLSFKTSEISVSVEDDENSLGSFSPSYRVLASIFCLESFTSTAEPNIVKIYLTVNGVHPGFGLDISPQPSTKSNVHNICKTLPSLYKKDFTNTRHYTKQSLFQMLLPEHESFGLILQH